MTVAAVSAEFDWTRTLLTSLRPPAWRNYLYFVLISVLAVIGVAFVFCAGLGSGLLMVTLVGIPRWPARLADLKIEVLALIAEGHSNSALAQHLSITERAVVAVVTYLDS